MTSRRSTAQFVQELSQLLLMTRFAQSSLQMSRERDGDNVARQIFGLVHADPACHCSNLSFHICRLCLHQIMKGARSVSDPAHTTFEVFQLRPIGSNRLQSSILGITRTCKGQLQFWRNQVHDRPTLPLYPNGKGRIVIDQLLQDDALLMVCNRDQMREFQFFLPSTFSHRFNLLDQIEALDDIAMFMHVLDLR